MKSLFQFSSRPPFRSLLLEAQSSHPIYMTPPPRSKEEPLSVALSKEFNPLLSATPFVQRTRPLPPYPWALCSTKSYLFPSPSLLYPSSLLSQACQHGALAHADFFLSFLFSHWKLSSRPLFAAPFYCRSSEFAKPFQGLRFDSLFRRFHFCFSPPTLAFFQLSHPPPFE